MLDPKGYFRSNTNKLHATQGVISLFHRSASWHFISLWWPSPLQAAAFSVFALWMQQAASKDWK